MVSDMLRPGMKVVWPRSIKVGRIAFNLAARMPLIHLYKKLQQAIGLKSTKLLKVINCCCMDGFRLMNSYSTL